MQNLTYRQQLSQKQVRIIKLLGHYCHVEEIIGMENPYHYRCKVQAAFGRNHKGETVSGIYQSSTHKIVPVDSCMIEDERADEIIVCIRKLLKSFKLKPFDENNYTGFLRHVLIKKGYFSKQIMVVLVTGTVEFPQKRAFVNALLSRYPDITTVIQNINNSRTSLVLGERSIVLYGTGKIIDQLCGYNFRISPSSFYQVNPVQAAVLYKTAMDFAGLTNTERVIDAYCGTGTIGIIAADRCKEVIGVELNADAIRDARENAKNNGTHNIKFINADAGELMEEMAAEKESADCVIMDPPRAGASLKFLRSLVKLSPDKVIYISCNPDTLARDLHFLSHNGYWIEKIQPVDMFPHTSHVETVVLMTKR